MIWGGGVHAKRHESGMGAMLLLWRADRDHKHRSLSLDRGNGGGEVASLVLSFFLLQGATVGSSRTYGAVLPRTPLSEHIPCVIYTVDIVKEA